jgi:phytoene desaturase
MKKAIVIGSGFGGLAIACRLRAMQYDVKVLEKQSNLGGRARTLDHNGFKYDAGPTVITAPYLINELYSLHDEDPRDYFNLLKVEPFYRFLFHDGSYFDYGSSLKTMLNEIKAKYSKSDAQGYVSLLKHSKRIFKTAYLKLSDYPFETLSSMFPYIPELMKIKFYNSVHTSVKSYLNNPNLIKAMSMHPLLVGGNPYTTTSIYLLIQYLEWKWGVYYAEGGTRSIVNGFEKLFKKLNIDCETNTEVLGLDQKNKNIKSVITNNGTYHADIVVSNADPSYFYPEVIKGKPKKIFNKPAMLKHSMGLFVLYFSTKKHYNNVKHHTIIFNKRHKELLDDIFDKKVYINDPSLYLHRPGATDKKNIQHDSDSFYVLAPVANNQSSIDWNVKGEEFSSHIINILSEKILPNLNEEIVNKFFVTPDYFEYDLNSFKGSGFGIQPIFRQSAYFRYSNKSNELNNLYFVGAGSHPGAGVPGVISSAKVTEKLILKYNG